MVLGAFSYLRRLRIRWFGRRLTLQEFQRRIQHSPHNVPWNDILRRDPCCYCGSYRNPTIEHVQPVFGKHGDARRGPVGNKVGACRGCNHACGSTPLWLFLYSRRYRHRRDIHHGRTRLYLSPHAKPLHATIGEQVAWKAARR